MLYSVLIYAVDGLFERLPEAEREAYMEQHYALQRRHEETGTLGPVAKLMGPASAVTVTRRADTVQVVDGPYAETKEQLLGFYVIDCETIEEAIEAAKALPADIATYEVRPIQWAGGRALVSEDDT